MWLTRTLLIVFIVIVALVLHDVRQILQLQGDLMKEHYIMRGEMNLIMDMALKNPHVDLYEEEPVEKETTTVEVEL